MRNYQTTGIVIGRTNFGEADRIVRLLTPDHGKISVVAKGVRKLKSKNAGHLEPLGETVVTLATGRNLDVVTSARLTWYPHTLTSDYPRLELAFMATHMIDRLVEEHEAHPDVYTLLREMLGALEAGGGGRVTELWFKLRLLHLLGYRPELTHCVGCGRRNPEAEYWFSPELGGIMDASDRSATARPMPTPAIKLWRIMSDHTLATVLAIGGAEALSNATLDLCDEFCHYHLGRTFSPGIAA